MCHPYDILSEIRDLITFLHLSKRLISIMSLSADSGKQYHLQCTGEALDTINAHAGDADITPFRSCICPFVQRVWVAFEYLAFLTDYVLPSMSYALT